MTYTDEERAEFKDTLGRLGAFAKQLQEPAQAREQRIAQLMAEDRPAMTAAEFETAAHQLHESGTVDSLDDMQPVPRAGKFFAEQILRQEVRSEGGVILQEAEDPTQQSIRTKRARVIQLGPARDGEPWDFDRGWDVVVPYHAGSEFSWMNQVGVVETLWIIDTNEVIAVFRPR